MNLALLLAVVTLALTGCLGIADVIKGAGENQTSVRIRLYNPLYGTLEIDRNLCLPVAPVVPSATVGLPVTVTPLMQFGAPVYAPGWEPIKPKP